MQTSAMMAVRAVTLLVCLAAVPMLAIFGKDIPAVIKSLLQSYASNPAKINSSPAGETDPPVFRPGLLASNPAQGTPGATPVVESAGPMPAGASPARPLVPITATSHRADSPASAATNENAQGSAMGSTGGTAAVGFPAGYFREAEQRLRELGATYYLLETLGPDSAGYRFFCKVALGSKPDETLAFFATDRDPLAAMHEVVRQVEGWRTHAHP